MRKETKIVTITCDVCGRVTEKTARRFYSTMTSVHSKTENFSVLLAHDAYDPDICPVCAEKILIVALKEVRKMQGIGEAQQ